VKPAARGSLKNTGRKNRQQFAIWAQSHKFLGLYLRNYIDNRKNVQQQYLPTCPYNVVNFGPLADEIVSLV